MREPRDFVPCELACLEVLGQLVALLPCRVVGLARNVAVMAELKPSIETNAARRPSASATRTSLPMLLDRLL